MFEASPFRAEETLKIVESRPPKELVQPCVHAILIERDVSGPAKPDLGKIQALLAGIGDPEGVRLFGVDYQSKLTALPDVSRFVNIEYLHIAGRAIRGGYEFLNALRRVRRLFLVSYPVDHLAAFRDSDLDYVRLIRGKVSRFDVSTREALLQSCPELTEFGRVRIARLLLDSCSHVDLATLARVEGLTSLQILGRREIGSFDFIDGCASLRKLVVTATPFRKADLTALFRSSSIEKIFLGGPDKLVEEVATHNHHAIVTNGDICFRGGVRRKDASEYYRDDDRA